MKREVIELVNKWAMKAESVEEARESYEIAREVRDFVRDKLKGTLK